MLSLPIEREDFPSLGIMCFVMSNICAFVLTWCLFVGNSRQTTSSVPWHRAPKYDRKHELTSDYKMISSSNGSSNRACVDEGFVLHLVKIQSGFRRGSYWKNCFSVHRKFAFTRVYRHKMHTCMACLTCKSSSQVNFTFLRFQTASSTRWPNPLFVLLCSDFIFSKSINQTRTMPNIFFFLFYVLRKHLDSSCQSTHGAPILNLLF